ncbi:MAG: trigger factor [Chloroflexota bacterium]|nr:trigger factor [Chloroflexota bacterium]
MKIEKNLTDDRQAELTVDYTAKEFEGFKRRAAKRIAKDTKIPGFRPGKAPYNVILNRYGEGTILQEALDILLEDDYPKIIDQAELEPSGSGALEKIESYDPPKLLFVVPLEPDVTLGDYREVRKDYELEEFDVSEVDDYITNLRRNAATIVPAEHPAGEGDLVYFNLSGEFLNPEEDEDATITDKTPQQVVIPVEGEESDSEWPFPGFAKSLLGVEAGETKEIEHKYPRKYHDEDYAGKTAVFTVDVQSVKELELPEFDEDFARSMGGYDTPEDFRESLEEQMRTSHQEEYDQAFFNDLLEQMTEDAEIVYPPQMLEHEEEHVLEEIKSRLEGQNLDFETYLKLRETDEETFIAEEVRPTAKERLERSLIIDALVKAEELKLDQELLQEQINKVMGEVYYSGNMQEMQKQMGEEAFSRAISMEGVQRTINAQLQERLKLIATGQPIPVEEEEPEAVDEAEIEAEASADVAAEDDASDDDTADKEVAEEAADEAADLDEKVQADEDASDEKAPEEEDDDAEEETEEEEEAAEADSEVDEAEE